MSLQNLLTCGILLGISLLSITVEGQCIPSPCSSVNTICNVVGSSAVCTCAAGFTGDPSAAGSGCSADIDECAVSTTNNCHVNATCTNTAGSYQCACNVGLMGDGVTCSGGANSCAGQAPCLKYTENSCVGGKRSVCLEANPAAVGCVLSSVPGQTIDTMCGYNNGIATNTIVNGVGSSCLTVEGGTRINFSVADGSNAEGVANTTHTIAAVTNTVTASCIAESTQRCPNATALHTSTLWNFPVADCPCSCGNWTAWSTCDSTTCKKERTRTCAGAPSCSLNQTESILCADNCLDTSLLSCYCGGWTAFGPCSVTCGTGEATRTRNCTLIGAQSACPESVFPTSNAENCIKNACEATTTTTTAAPCTCGPWSTIGECSASCGNGHITRSRTCQGSCGNALTSDFIVCNNNDCPTVVEQCTCEPFKAFDPDSPCDADGTTLLVRECKGCPSETPTAMTEPCQRTTPAAPATSERPERTTKKKPKKKNSKKKKKKKEKKEESVKKRQQVSKGGKKKKKKSGKDKDDNKNKGKDKSKSDDKKKVKKRKLVSGKNSEGDKGKDTKKNGKDCDKSKKKKKAGKSS